MCKVCSQNFEKRHDEDDYLKVRVKTKFEEVDVKVIDRHVMNLFGKIIPCGCVDKCRNQCQICQILLHEQSEKV